MYLPKNTICTCSNCGIQFKYEDSIIHHRKLYGIDIEEKCCPNCKHIGFTMEQHLKWLEARHKFLNV